MAHPGYPHGPNPYPPAQPAPPAAPPRRGTSKAVPIVFSIALAGGTFAGLTLALGTGKKDDAAETKKTEPVAVVTPDAGVARTPDAAPPTTVTLTPDAAPAPAKATLTIEVTPPDVKTRITVDGQEVSGPVEITLDKNGTKTVKVVAKASGYRTYEEKVTVEGNETLAIKLRKRSSSGGGGSSGSGKGSNENVIDL